jgi:NitT/TauT family transport system ATP-binding protein
VLEVDRVTKVYLDDDDRGVRALHDVSFEIFEGEFVALLGPSGCGKSTLLTIMAGLLQPSSGHVRVRGQEIVEPQTDIGFVFQSDVLLEWRSAEANVLLQMEARGLRGPEYKDRVKALFSLMGLSGFENAWPYQLSGGMRQRVAICRALIHEPSILLMDEPFGALDALTRDQLGLDLLRMWDEKRRTAVFVTHSIPEAVFLSDRVIVMTPRPGQVAETVEVRLPRPRTLAMRETTEFLNDVGHIMEIFLRGGVLRERSLIE